MRRRVFQALGAALLIVAALAAGAYVAARRSLPAVEGTVTVNGVTARVEIIRDRDAIPHIFAATRRDALYGLGYVHAQDRLWQMEFQRRIGSGRLSEIFGRVTVPQDMFLRTVGFARAARAAWDRLPDEVRADVEAYVHGVNAFIRSHRGTQLPPEFLLLRFSPEPWTGADVIVWQKMMAWDLSKNFSYELLRDDIAAAVGPARLAELMPSYPADGLSILSARDMPWLKEGARPAFSPEPSASSLQPSAFGLPSPSLSSFAAALRDGNPTVADLLLDPIRNDSLGSNNWVVDGTMTATGKPVLANDPHLDAHIPSTWYLAHLSAGDFDVIGGTLPGTPVVAIGRNRFIAWGETNAGADVEDLYREHLDSTGRLAEYQGRLEPLQLIHDTIPVRGSDPVALDIRITRHGPIVSDALNAIAAARPRGPKPPPLPPLAFRWTALDPDDTTIVAFLEINQARNWADFTSAMRDYVVPSQNFVYADRDGHIGYYAPGRIPIRAAGDGSRTADGASGADEWTGWVPFDQLPHAFDPPEHFIVTANNRPVPPPYPYTLGGEWTEPYRARRIRDLLREKPRLTVDDLAAIQRDTLSLHGRSLVPLLLERAHPGTEDDVQALAAIRRWDGDAEGRSGAAAIFESWVNRLLPAIVEDDLGPLVTADYTKVERTSFAARFLANTLAQPDSSWCDDRRTPARESCDDVVTASLHEAVEDLRSRLGRDPGRWRWDALHWAMFPHQGLDAVGLLRPLLSRSMPNGGDWSTVNVGSYDAEHPFEQRAIPGYRQVVDLSSQNDSRFLDSVGESGHFLSPHYTDFMSDWHAVRYRPMRTDRSSIEAGAVSHLTLRP